MIKNIKYVFIIALAPLFFAGCMANLANSLGMNIGSSATSGEKFIVGDYAAAATLAEQDKDKKAAVDIENLLPTLKAGNGYLFANEYNKSLKMLDESEAIIKFHHQESLAKTTSDYIAGLMLNDKAISYHASISEAIMVNTYKALNYMSLKKFDKARVEFNRAVDRERRAKETYAELISKQKDAIAQKKSEQKSKEFEQTLYNPQIKNILRQNYSLLDQFEAYPDFINPFTTYLAGLFFLIEGDYEKSSSLLKEVYGMMPQNQTIKSDFEMVENVLSGKEIADRYAWIIYENGLGPIKREFKINIPMYLASNKIFYTGIALPKLERRSQATSKIDVFSQNEFLGETSVVGDMDRVVFTEFNYSYNDILMRAIFSAILKTYTQNEASDKNVYLGLATATFQFLTTHADTRIWNTLPKDFQVTRVKIPADDKLLLRSGAHSIDINIDKNAKHSIVYVRIPTAVSKPSVNVINF